MTENSVLQKLREADLSTRADEAPADEAPDVKAVMSGEAPALSGVEKNLGIEREPGEDDASFAYRLSKELEAYHSDESHATYEAGKRLYVIASEKLYQEDSFSQFLSAHPISEWGRSKVMEIMAQVRDFILGEVTAIPQERLERIGWRKVQEIHGLIRDGVVDAETALSAAESLSVRDLIKQKQVWKTQWAKSQGLKPQVIHSCKTCARLRVVEFGKPGETRRLVLGRQTVISGERLIQEDQPLFVKKLIYCGSTGKVLAIDNDLSGREAEKYGENCPFYVEAF